MDKSYKPLGPKGPMVAYSPPGQYVQEGWYVSWSVGYTHGSVPYYRRFDTEAEALAFVDANFSVR